MRMWRNWQTRMVEGHVFHDVGVQIPSSAPKQKLRQSPGLFLIFKFEKVFKKCLCNLKK